MVANRGASRLRPTHLLPKLLPFFQLLFLLPLFSSSPAETHVGNSRLKVSLSSPITFSLSQGEGAVRSPVVITNEGTETLNWSALASQTWLKFEPASGSLAPSARESMELIVDPVGFSPGVYIASAQISSGNTIVESFDVTLTEKSAFAGDPFESAQHMFPSDSGMVNVKAAFGAKGDGVSDDTRAIQQAISATVHHPQGGPRVLYFPSGIYLVSRPLQEKDLKSQWNSLLTLQGENRATTALRLTDNNPLYQNASAPADVLHFASQNGAPKGGGNSAFDNNIFDLTIDVGRGNPGAVALDFLGNNYCALRNVTLQSSDPGHAGAIGLALLRYASGPCLMKNVLINGFDYGIRVANTEYSLTFEDLTLLNQRVVGIDNSNNVLSIRHLFSANKVPVINNRDADGLVTLVGGILQDGSDKYSAMQNKGTLYARDVNSSGYSSVLQGIPGISISEYDSGPVLTPFGGKASSLNLPVEETPYFEDPSLSNWKSVTAFGADPTGRIDSSDAIQEAIDSGATTVYFPTGVYSVARTILVRGAVRKLAGFDSSLNPSGEMFGYGEHPAPLFKVETGTGDVTLNHFRIGAFSPHPAPGVIFVQQDSARPLVLRDLLVGSQPTTFAYQNTSRGTGSLFVENVAGQPWQIFHPQDVFARQINPEGNRTKITNKGGKLWVFGLKTEGAGTNIETTSGGSTEVLGGLIYPVWKTAPDAPSFTVNDSRASFIYAVSSHKPASANTNFAVQVRETQHGVSKSLLINSLPARGLGTMMPLYTSGDFPPDSKKSKAEPVVSH